MNKLVLTVGCLGVLALGYWGWGILFPSDEARIRRLLIEVGDVASFSPQDKPLAQLAAANKLADFFVADGKVDVDAAGRSIQIVGRDAIRETAIAARRSSFGVTVKLLDPIIEFGSKLSAVVFVTGVAETGDEQPEIQILELQLKREDGTWRIAQVKNVPDWNRRRP